MKQDTNSVNTGNVEFSPDYISEDLFNRIKEFNIRTSKEWKGRVFGFNLYQEESKKTRLGVFEDHPLVYSVLGLSGEAGEVAEKAKKIIRDGSGYPTDEQKMELAKECGDVLWYLTQLVDILGLSLEDVAYNNLEKLFSRKERGRLGGSGDNR